MENALETGHYSYLTLLHGNAVYVHRRRTTQLSYTLIQGGVEDDIWGHIGLCKYEIINVPVNTFVAVVRHFFKLKQPSEGTVFVIYRNLPLLALSQEVVVSLEGKACHTEKSFLISMGCAVEWGSVLLIF